MDMRKLVIGCDGGLATSLNQPYNGTPFKDLKKMGMLRTFGVGDNKYDVEGVRRSLKNTSHTNVYRLLDAIDDKDMFGYEQECQYFPGHAAIPESQSTSTDALVSFLYLCFGVEVTERISQAYQWLCGAFYGPKNAKALAAKEATLVICVGYSRGAFTARAVAGMIERFGMLKAKPGISYQSATFKSLVDRLRATYFWQNIEKAGLTGKLNFFPEDESAAVKNVAELGEFKKAELWGIACWDTVGAFGVPLSQWHKDALNDPKLAASTKPLRDQLEAMGVNPGAPLTFEHFYDQVIPKGTGNAVHALALNEYMEPFRPCLWEGGANATVGTYSPKLEQCWFPGDHTDVCGGVYGDQQIADITLAWMMSQLERLKVLKFKPGYIKQAFEDSKRIAQREGKTMQKWGRGETNSNYNVINNLRLGVGHKPRDPGDYHRLAHDGSHTSDLLQDTNETIHYCVKVRLDNPKGLGANGIGDYAPAALRNWKKPAVFPNGPYIWRGWGSHIPDKLQEPKLGQYEVEMQKLYGM